MPTITSWIDAAEAERKATLTEHERRADAEAERIERLLDVQSELCDLWHEIDADDGLFDDELRHDLAVLELVEMLLLQPGRDHEEEDAIRVRRMTERL